MGDKLDLGASSKRGYTPHYKRDSKIEPTYMVARAFKELIPTRNANKGRDVKVMEYMRTEAEPTISTYKLWGEDSLFKNQLFIALTYQALRENPKLVNIIHRIDWSDHNLDPKISLLKEIGSKVKNILGGVDINYVEEYSNSQAEFIEVKSIFAEVGESIKPYNINLHMYMLLIQKQIIVLDPLDTAYKNGRALLHQPYTSKAESFTSTCLSADGLAVSPCVVKYFRDISILNHGGMILKSWTAESLKGVPSSFTQDFKGGTFAYLAKVLVS